MLNKELLRGLFKYKDGNLLRKVKTAPCVNVGDIAGCVQSSGYRAISVNNKLEYSHRLIFLYHHGFTPKEVDHIDGDKLNNKIENLRECTRSQNNFNSKAPKTNTSGVKGVSWHKKLSKWRAYLHVNKKQKNLGLFEDLELAQLVVSEARELFHKEFKRD